MKLKSYFLCLLLIIALMFPSIVAWAQKKPTTVAELALYRGADRQQVLEEGAKKEGKLTFYTKGVLDQSVRPVVNAFQKRYPYIKVEIWRASSEDIIPRLLEEYKAGKYIADVIEINQPQSIVLRDVGILQPFYSPEIVNFEADAIVGGPDGTAFAVGDYQSCTVLAYNTKLITKEELPKTYPDLLDPKWKGKLPIAGSGTGLMWMEGALVGYGEDFVRKLAKQEFIVHMVSGRSLLDMIINGEYAFSPSTANSHVEISKRKGAPVDWVPIEPVSVSAGSIMMAKHAPNPHATLLFLNFDLSKEIGEFFTKTGYRSPRKDMPDVRKFKKFFGFDKAEELLKAEELFTTLFLKR